MQYSRRPLYVSMMVLVCLGMTACIDAMFSSADYLGEVASRYPYKQLAMEGDVEAQYQLGQSYCCGERPKYNNVDALYWYCQAAKQGQRDAQYGVAQLYETAHEYPGNIIPVDHVMAYTYYSLAARNAHPDAQEDKERVEKTLTDMQKQEASYLLGAWPSIACEVSR